jgi:serine/threonine protein phosphatase 1
LGQAKTPDNTRLYAIGDVHGCHDLLVDVHAAVERDLALRPVADHRIVHIGDYIDRGPDPAAVIDRLVKYGGENPGAIFLIGNHERMFLDFLADPAHNGPVFIGNGGLATLESYGVSDRWSLSGRDMIGLAGRITAVLPASHVEFLASLVLSVRLGDFYFCHAGVRPGVALDDQDSEDLVWIRDEFLIHGKEFEAVIVHGHTPVPEPEIRLNRINIDTGAVFTGRLSCLALEGATYRFL